ncbi:hypothetical protein BCL57_003320 [Agromyces flavus]|uniref:CHAT domain-containing protein n=1 Tax=Agromyces flavus TaxID=589382 RepID=A0A1H1N886_9MICO|nr:CHAT domain-containing protein [Agromyces flavus]MCP2369137.1 hypothetical protein [Agromyces flavus]GGI48617.1 hypothetical protein GCM10010932_33050 [Agromyces flavus]SDR95206.1 CHAT domain-containing protein [Agromyces flavus]
MLQAGRVIGEVAPPAMVAVQAEMKPIVAARSATTLVVRLTPDAPGAAGASGATDAAGAVDPATDAVAAVGSRPVTVTVVPRGLRFPLGTARTRTLRLPASGTVEARFKLIAADRGPAEVMVIVRQDVELPLATLRLTTEVVDSDDHDQTGVARVVASVTRPDPAVASRPTIRIDEELVGTRSTLHAAVSVGGDTHHFRVKLGDALRIAGDVQAAFAGFRARLAGMSPSERAESIDRGLRALGAELADRVLDRQARELLWAHRDELDGIVVQTTAALDLPWELLLVRAPGTKGDPDDRFLADYGVTRWVVGAPHPTSIRVRRTRARYLCPQYAEPDLALSRTSAEGEAVARRFGAIAVEPDAASGLAALMSGGFDLLHFAGHARWSPRPEHRQEVLLGGFRPDDTGLAARYSDADARRDLRKRPESETSPLVVLNATDLGRLPAGRTCRTGFAEAFLRAGAGAFVWRGWSLDDDPASPFVEAFYDAFVEGSTIEEAAKAGRTAAREAGDPSGLAFAVYAHPEARLRIE